MQGLVPAGLQASTRISPGVIHVGDTITVAVAARPGEGVETPHPARKLGVFDLLGVTKSDSSGWAQVRIYVTSFETGTQTLPSIAIPVHNAGRIDSLRTPAYRISIESLLPADTTRMDTVQLRAERPPLDIPQHFLWGVFFGYVLVLSALAGLGWILYRWLRKQPADLPIFRTEAPPRPPEELALEALDTIAARGYLARGLFKEHYTEVMDVLRSYIEGRYGVEALDRTTFELVQTLLMTPLDPSHRDGLHRMLDEADLVKFAKYTPDTEAGTRLLAEARRWVLETVPAPEPVAVKAGAVWTPPDAGASSGSPPAGAAPSGDRPNAGTPSGSPPAGGPPQGPRRP